MTVGLRMRDNTVIHDGLKPGEVIVSQDALLVRTEDDQGSDAAPRSKPMIERLPNQALPDVQVVKLSFNDNAEGYISRQLVLERLRKVNRRVVTGSPACNASSCKTLVSV